MDFTQTLAQMMNSGRNPQLPDVRRSPVILPWATGDTGYGQVGFGVGKGLSEALVKGYVDPQLQIAKEHALLEQSPVIAMERGKQTWDLLNSMDPTVATKTLSNPDVQKRLAIYSKYMPELFPQVGGGQFTFSPREKTKPELEAQTIAQYGKQAPGGLRNFFIQPTLAETGVKEAQKESSLAGAAEARARTTQLIPAQANLYGAETSLAGARTGNVQAETLQMPDILKLKERQVAADELRAKSSAVDAGTSRSALLEEKKRANVSKINATLADDLQKADSMRLGIKDPLGNIKKLPIVSTTVTNRKLNALGRYAEEMKKEQPDSVHIAAQEATTVLAEYVSDLQEGVAKWQRSPLSPEGMDPRKAVAAAERARDNVIGILTKLPNKLDGNDPYIQSLKSIEEEIRRIEALIPKGGKK